MRGNGERRLDPGINVPATLAAGSQFVFQALAVESSTLDLAFTSPVLLIAG